MLLRRLPKRSQQAALAKNKKRALHDPTPATQESASVVVEVEGAQNKRLKTEDTPVIANAQAQDSVDDEEDVGSNENSTAEMSEDDGNLRF